MTIEQIVDIPADHRVFFEFLAPKEIPTGRARVELKVTPVSVKYDKPVPDTGNNQIFSESSATPISDSLLGIFSNLGNISLEEIREERLAKYLK